jgi:diguanylate cyclase (GGDEF)-like protein/PAS domain S-box-containing protein
MQSPMDLSANAEAFLTALDSLKTQRWSLLWLKPSLSALWPAQDSPRLRSIRDGDYARLEACLQDETWGEATPDLKRALGLCETSAWALTPLKGVGLCLLEDPVPGAAPRLEPILRLWESALQACVLYQRASQPNRNVAQRRLGRLRRDYRSLVEHAVVGIYRSSPEGRWLAANPALSSMLGYEDPKAMLATGLKAGQGFYAQPGRRDEFLRRLTEQGELRDFESKVLRRDGSTLWVSENARAVRDSKGRLRWIEGMVLDVSKRMLAEDELLHGALHDALTGLPNRALFLDRLALALRRCQRDPAMHFAVLFLDLDRFKVVNDSLGHQAGDELLKGIAQRLQSGLRPGDTVARLGGDEFCVLLEGLGCSEDALPVAERILVALAEPLRAGGSEIYPSASIGVAFGGPHYAQPESLVRDADTAMYRAKNKGKGRLEVFDLRMHEEAAQRLQIEHGLRRAVERDELWVAYQPLVSLLSGEVRGFEALARWKHPVLGLVPPDRFIPVAEETGLIEGLGARVLEIACAQAEAWAGMAPDGSSPSLSVNLSAKQLRSPNLVGRVAETLKRHHLAPGRLKLEITESLLMEDPAFCARILGELGELGTEIWLDDFGSGYSSLGSLSQFPIHSVKLDRTFILGLAQGDRALGLLEGVLALARQLRLGVVAEGIETEAQAALLRSLGCPMAQGYLYSRPLPAADAQRYLCQSRLGAAPI